MLLIDKGKGLCYVLLVIIISNRLAESSIYLPRNIIIIIIIIAYKPRGRSVQYLHRTIQRQSNGICSIKTAVGGDLV